MDKNRAGRAAVLSFVFSGLGQLYNGQIVKGLTMIFFACLGILLVVLGAILIYVWLTQKATSWPIWIGIVLFLIGLVLICIIGAYSIFDAYKNGGIQ